MTVSFSASMLLIGARADDSDAIVVFDADPVVAESARRALPRLVPDTQAMLSSTSVNSVLLDDRYAGAQLMHAVFVVPTDIANFEAYTLTVSGLSAYDWVSVTSGGLVNNDFGSLYYDGAYIGNVSGGLFGEPLAITLTDLATTEAVNAVIARLTYEFAPNDPEPGESIVIPVDHELHIDLIDPEGHAMATRSPWQALPGTDLAANPFAGVYLHGWDKIAIGDIDNDGDLDLVAVGDRDYDWQPVADAAWGGSVVTKHENGQDWYANSEGNLTAMRVLINQGNGAYVQGTSSRLPGDLDPAGGYHRTIALADVTGEGAADLFFGQTRWDGDSHSGPAYSVQAALNFGGGVFGYGYDSYTTPGGAVTNSSYYAIAAGDYDGDGLVDAISVRGNWATIHFASPDGGYGLIVASELEGADPGFVSIGLIDFDGDGDLDLYGYTSAGEMRAFASVGFGLFAGPQTNNPFAFLGVEGGNTVFADLNGDGRKDMVVSHGGTIDVYWNTSPTGFTGTAGEPFSLNFAFPNETPSGTDKSVTLEGTASYQFTAADFGFYDPEGTAFASVVITTLPDDGVIMFNGSPVFAGTQIQAENLNALSYAPTGKGSHSFTFQVQDSGGDANGGDDLDPTPNSFTFDVNPTPPALHGTEPSLTFGENTVNAAAQLIAPNAVFADPDDDLDGGTVVITGLLAEDRVGVRDTGTGAGQIGVDGASISYGGVTIGVIDGGVGGTLTITFNADATSAAVQAAVRSLTYANVSDAPAATRTLNLLITGADGADIGHEPGGFTLAAQNPYALETSATYFDPAFVDLNGDGLLDMVAGGETGFVDAFIRNVDGSLTQLAPEANPFAGVYVGSRASVAFTDLDGDGRPDFVVAGGDGQFGIGAFHNNGDGSFTELAGGDNPFFGLYAGYYADLAFGDVDGDGAEDLLIVRLDDVPSFYKNVDGSFVDQGSDNPFLSLAIGVFGGVTFADLDSDGRADLISSGYSEFVSVPTLTAWHNDGGSFTQLTGANDPFASAVNSDPATPQAVDYDGDGTLDVIYWTTSGRFTALHGAAPALGRNISVGVTAESDAPAGADSTVTIAEDGSHVFQASDFGFSDPDGDSPHELIITSLPVNGTLLLDGGPVHEGDAIAWANIVDGWLVFTPAANSHGDPYASFDFQVRDDGAEANTDLTPNTITVDVTSVEDVPVFVPAPIPPLALTHSAGAIASGSQQSVSADGNLIVFASSAQLVPGDTDARSDIYLLDRATGDLARVTSLDGAGYSTGPVISADGSTVAFFSTMDNLVDGDTNGVIDAFVYDVATGTISRVSKGTAGEQGSGFSMYDTLAISPDGSLVGFTSMMTGLVPEDHNGTDVFLKNLLTGELTRVTVDSEGVELPQGGYAPFFSADGTKLGFATYSPATAGDDNLASDIYVRDLATGELTLVTATFENGDVSYREPIFSPDGTKILFSAYVNGLVDGDANGDFDLFLLHIATGEITIVSSSASGAVGNEGTYSGRFSPDGTKIVFNSEATNLIDGETGPDTNGLFIKDIATGEVTRLSVNPDGSPNVAWMVVTAFLNDGELLISSQNALVPGDPDDYTSDFYVLGLGQPPITYVDGGGPVTITPGVVLSDADRDMVDGATLSVAITANGEASDLLTFADGSPYSFENGEMFFKSGLIGTYSFANDAMTFHFNADADLSMVREIVEAIQFESSSTVPTEGDRSVTFTYDDGTTAGAVSFTRQVEVVEVNNAPIGANGAVTFDEDTVHIFDIAEFGFALTDSEGDALTHILIESLPVGGILIFDGAPVFFPGQAIPIAGIEAGLLSFFPLPDVHGSFDFTFRGVDDGGTDQGGHDTSETYTFTLDIASVNDNPVVSLGAFGTGDVVLDMVEGDYVQLAPEAQVTDDAASLEGGSITVSIADGTNDDRIFILPDGSVTVDGDALLVEGVEIGRFTGGGSEPLVVTLGADATPYAIEVLIHRVGYTSLSDAPPATRTITVVVTDSEGGTSGPLTATVTIEAVDDPTAPQSDYADVFENGVAVIDVLANEEDPDGGLSPAVAEINGVSGSVVTLASGATVTLNPDGTLSYDTNGAYGWLVSSATATATGAANGQAIDSFTYALADGSSATVYVTVKGVDSAGDKLLGNDAANALLGTSDNDVIDGGLGADRMRGGLGDDIFYIDNAGDRALEYEGQGRDTVFSSVSYSLGSESIETLVLTGHNAINGAGNGLANVLTGNDAANALSGDGGNDVIDGGLGVDRMRGGLGDDIFIVDNAGDQALEFVGEGYDIVRSSVSYVLGSESIEALVLTGGAAINGTGNGLDNVLTGNDAANALSGGGGNDVINGGLGADRMRGGLGDDIIIVDNAGDQALEFADEGYDTVRSSVSYVLGGSESIEALVLTGHVAINGTGNGLNNVLTGNDAANALSGGAGNDVIDGGSGADRMRGGLGDDSFHVDDAGDQALEYDGEGYDTVYSSVNYSLGSEAIEALTLTGIAAINGLGNGLDNVLTGNNAANRLNGGGGDDALHGGLGADTLTGGTGADSFWFDTALGGGNVDRILDFDVGADSILLDGAIFGALGADGVLASDALVYGTIAQDADDRILYDSATGRIYYDADGSGAGAAVQFAQITAGTALTNAHFTVFGTSGGDDFATQAISDFSTLVDEVLGAHGFDGGIANVEAHAPLFVPIESILSGAPAGDDVTLIPATVVVAMDHHLP